MLLVCGVLILALFILVDITVESGLLQTFDVEGFTVVNSLRPPVWVDSAMVVFSLYGREGVWGGLIVVLFFLGGEREKKAAVTMGLLYLILIGTGYAVKGLDGRLRPYDALEGVRLLVPRESDYSFPSGHTLIVAGGAVVAWIMLKRWLAAILTVEASLVAFSRIYVGVHYPMDVVGGALLGAGFALFLCSNPKLVERIYNKIPGSIRKLGRTSLPA
jgi:membrane-associated phospholipid phosphatase